MEEVYQQYKDQVNFVGVYGREAHPEENPFFAGFETKDLGWDHRYNITTTMEERAQRARWMKTELEPDAEMPMIIDYVNSPLGTTDAIKNTYQAKGFYSGVVIDCDGKVLFKEFWGWHAPGSQWWFLSLALVEDLKNFLDSYLADPPACYDPSSEPYSPPKPSSIEEVSCGKKGLPSVLIVDDDGGSTYEGYYKIPLGNLKKHYQVWDVQEAGSPSSDILENHEVVVWFTGDTVQNTLTKTDRTNLASYLDGGGKLFLSGQDIGQDIGDTLFYRDYLHATLVEDVTETSQLLGEDILSGAEVSISVLDHEGFPSFGNDGARNQEAPSQIGLLDEAVGVFRYDKPDSQAWAGLRWGGDYKVAYFAFGFEGIGDQGAAAFRFKIMKNLFAWFEEGMDEVQTVVIDKCDSGVENHFLDDGCTISDRIEECAMATRNHGSFVKCVSHLTNDLKRAGIINGKEKAAIQSCAAQSAIAHKGDCDGDGCVNLSDFSILKKTYGKSRGMSGYDERADFDEDGGINLLDFSIFKKHYGECASD